MKTLKEVADMTGRSKTAIRKHMKKLGVVPLSVDTLPEDHADRIRLRAGTLVLTDEDCGALLDSVTGNDTGNLTGINSGNNSGNQIGNIPETELVNMILQEKENRIRELREELQKTEKLLQAERDRVDWLLKTINNQAIVIAQSKAETLPETITDNEPETRTDTEPVQTAEAAGKKPGILARLMRSRRKPE